MRHNAKLGAKRRLGMVDRFQDGLLTPMETASYLEIPQSTFSPAAYAVRHDRVEVRVASASGGHDRALPDET